LRTVRTPAPISALAFVRRVLVVGSGGHVRIVHGTNGSVRTIPLAGAVVAAALTPDGRTLAVAVRRTGRVTTELVDVVTRRVRRVLPERGVDALAVSPDGRLLATGSTDRTGRLWRIADGRLLHVLPHRGHVVAVRFSAGGGRLLTSSADGTVGLWDVRSGARSLLLVGATGAAEDAAFSPDGQEVAAAFADRLARVYDTTDGRLLAPLAGHRDAVTSVAFDPAGRAIGTGSDDGTIRIWDANAGDQLVPIDRRTGSVTARFVGGDRVLTISGREARLVTVRGRVLKRMRVQPQKARTKVTSPDGAIVATTRGRDAFLWDAKTGRLLHRLVGHRSLVTDAEFSPDGRELVTASDVHDARIWDVASGRLLHVLRGHFFAVRTASISPDGRWVVTASQLTAGLWDAGSGRLLLYLRGHTKPLTGASFSPDGRWIVTGSEDGTARVVRCDVCRDLAGLEQVARQRLAALGR
jgi:WD40 repeat protein